MKLLVLSLLSFLHLSSTPWLTDFSEAQKQAVQQHKYILLNFSGSDWCGPCIRLHKEIFDSQSFLEMADKKLILVNADFPRLKKNQLPKDQQQKNEKLADTYNSAGHFPYTVLLTPEGRIVKDWDGLPKESPEIFADEVKMAVNVGQ